MIRAITAGSLFLVLLAGSATPAGARPTPAQKCAANKMRCVAKEFVSALGCHAKGALAGQPVDTACLDAAKTKQARCWQKADSKGGCIVTFPAEHLHQDVADWTADIASDLPSS